MKRFAIIALFLTLTGCASKTAYGPCIGAFDDKDPSKVYKLSVRNTVLAVLFIETIFVPVIVVVNEALCPVGEKKP